MALAAVNSGVCGSNIWTNKTLAYGFDSRSSLISNATGNIWVAWDNSTAPTTICSYLSVDSVVGNRLFFATPRGEIVIGSAATTTPGADLIPTLIDNTTGLPSAVLTALDNQPFNVAFSDIRPEDAMFATTRALTPLGAGTSGNTSVKGLGYGPGPIGANIGSAFSSSYAQVVDYAMSGKDPITGDAIPAYSTINVGAEVGLVVVNVSDTSAGGLGNPEFTNINRFVLARVLAGKSTRTRDLVPGTGVPIVPLNVVLREPISGTMNTFEYCITNSKEIGISQELGVNPAITPATCPFPPCPAQGNPLDSFSADGAWRKRAIGTGQMVQEVGSNVDTLGYTFFSFGNVNPLATGKYANASIGNTGYGKYIMVDGVDPLYASYNGGTLPTCSAPCTNEVTFPNLLNGTYPIWTIMRVITSATVPPGVSSLVTAAQTQVATIPDFVPIGALQVFRSHYTQSGITGMNGHLPKTVEAGGDVGGAVLTIQTDLDNITDNGKELTTLKQ
jgi:ABC-type phosphate transport system substrate-binding protein